MIKTRYLFLDSPISTDLSKLKQKLETLTSEGWIVTKVRVNYLKLTYSQPQNLQYEIDYLPQVDAITSDEDPAILDYKVLCEQSGWNYVGHHQNLFIFCADKHKIVLPLQTDEVIKKDVLISITLKNHLLPFFFITLINLMNQSHNSDLMFFTTYSGNMTLTLNHLIFPALFIYLLFNLVQIIALKKDIKWTFFETYLPTSLRIFYRTILLTLIVYLFLMPCFLLLENNNLTLPITMVLFILLLFSMSFVLNSVIKKRYRSRKRNLTIFIVGTLVISFSTLSLVLHGLFSIPITVSQIDDSFDSRIITLSELLPEQKIREIDPYFEHSSSFLIANYDVYSDFDTDYYGYHSYELRSPIFQNYFLQLLIKNYNQYNHYTELNLDLDNSHFIYDRDTQQVSGLILTQGLITYVIESRAIHFDDPSVQKSLLGLLEK